MLVQFLLALSSPLMGQAVATSLSSTISSQSSFSFLYEALTYHDLTADLDAKRNTTYFAPNNDALKYLADFGINLTTTEPDIAKAIILYGLTEGVHSSQSIVSNGGVQLIHSALYPPLYTNVSDGQALKLRTNSTGSKPNVVLETGLQILTKVVETDIPFDNGLLHGTSTNMVLPHNVSETAKLGKMTEFLDLLQESGLEAEFNSLADMTLFIPHDMAVKQVRPALDILTPGQLKAVVANHVVPNHVLYESRLRDAKHTYQTLGDNTLVLRRGERRQIYANDVETVRQDVLLYGGIAHIIDGVLFPEASEAAIETESSGVVITYEEDVGKAVQKWTTHHMLFVWLFVSLTFATVLLKGYQWRRKNRQRWLMATTLPQGALFSDYKSLH